METTNTAYVSVNVMQALVEEKVDILVDIIILKVEIKFISM